WPGFIHLLLALLALPGLLLLPGLLHEVAKRILPTFGENAEAMQGLMGNWPLWFGVLTIGLGPGLGEELWCRGFLGRGLVGRYGMIGGVVLTSFFFGLLHVEPRQAAAVALMAIVLHLAYLATRSFWVPVLLHTMN